MELQHPCSNNGITMKAARCSVDAAPKASRVVLTLVAWLSMSWLAMHFMLVWFEFSVTYAERLPQSNGDRAGLWKSSSEVAVILFLLIELLACVVLISGLRPRFLKFKTGARVVLGLGASLLVAVFGFAIALGSGGVLVDPVLESRFRHFVWKVAEEVVR